MHTLRHIAVFVTEPAPGHYVWQLREAAAAGADGWQILKESAGGRIEWLDAFNDGVDEVLQLTRDGRKGPRNG